MPTLDFGTIKRRVMTLAGVDNARAGIVVQQVLTELLESRSWSFLKAEGTLTTKAPKSDGTVSLTTSTTVTGSGTSFASTDVESYLRVSNDVAFYRVTNVSGQVLTIDPAYVGSSFTNASYTLFRHIYSLASDFRRMLSPAFYRRLTEQTLQDLDRRDPRRTFLSNNPLWFAYRGRDANGVQQIEIAPVPSEAVVIRYAYLKTIAEPSSDATRVEVRPDVVIYAAASIALATRIAEKPELASALAPLLDRYEAQAQVSLQSAIEADLAVAGAAKAVRGVPDEGLYGNDILLQHDIFAP